MSSMVTALREKPSDPEIHFNHGMALAHHGNWKAAAQEYEATIALIPSHSHAHCSLAQALAHIGDQGRSESELVLAREYGSCESAGIN